jgi:predicted GIY-YIG superfamily endonuclease
MTKQPAVYILASRRNGTLYTGVTGDLVRRVWEHRSGLVEGFTKRYLSKYTITSTKPSSGKSGSRIGTEHGR